MSQALRSQARDVREVARDTIKKISLSLGTSYLSLVIKEMKAMLQRGYQLHVLGYTIHSILECMQDELKPCDLDNCVGLLMDVCIISRTFVLCYDHRSIALR